MFSKQRFVPSDFFSSSVTLWKRGKCFVIFGLKVNTVKIDTASISDDLIKPANWEEDNISSECK